MAVKKTCLSTKNALLMVLFEKEVRDGADCSGESASEVDGSGESAMNMVVEKS